MNAMRYLLISFLLIFSQLSLANDAVDEILAESFVPSGVVFEMLTHEEDSWPKALAYIRSSVKRLHIKYPDLPIVIVSHGMEQFALLDDTDRINVTAHSEVKSLLKNNIKLEVCGTFAEWNGYDKSDFPDYVTVVDQAPRSIELYRQDGYSIVLITQTILDTIPSH